MSDTRIYKLSDYDALVKSTFDKIVELGIKKGGEYAGDSDRLANFRRNAEAVGIDYRTIWRVYAGKHWDAITQYIKDCQEGKTRDRMEGIDGRVDDLIVYLLLFKAMLEENSPMMRDFDPEKRSDAGLDIKTTHADIQTKGTAE